MSEKSTVVKFIRTCQECGHQQEDKEPNHIKGPTQAYLDRKCKKCRSSGLDYGSEREAQSGY